VIGIRLSGDLLKTDGYQTTPEAFLSTVPGKGASSAQNGNAQIAAYYTPASSFSAYVRGGYHQQKEDIGGYRFGDLIKKRFFQTDQSPVTRRAPEQPAKNVAASFIARHHAIGNQETYGTSVIIDNAK